MLGSAWPLPASCLARLHRCPLLPRTGSTDSWETAGTTQSSFQATTHRTLTCQHFESQPCHFNVVTTSPNPLETAEGLGSVADNERAPPPCSRQADSNSAVGRSCLKQPCACFCFEFSVSHHQAVPVAAANLHKHAQAHQRASAQPNPKNKSLVDHRLMNTRGGRSSGLTVGRERLVCRTCSP